MYDWTTIESDLFVTALANDMNINEGLIFKPVCIRIQRIIHNILSLIYFNGYGILTNQLVSKIKQRASGYSCLYFNVISCVNAFNVFLIHAFVISRFWNRFWKWYWLWRNNAYLERCILHKIRRKWNVTLVSIWIFNVDSIFIIQVK